MSPTPKLMTTRQYDLFELSKFNRDVRKINKLMASMRKHGFIAAHPLHVVKGVRGKLEIKAGHHRWTAAKELGIPVLYVICEDTATIHELEDCTTVWSMRDYLESYCRLGDKQSQQYQIIADYVVTTGVSISCAVSILAGKSDMSEFKRGDLTITKLRYGQQLASIIIRCKAAGFCHASNTLFITAIRAMLMVKEFDVKQFLHRFEINRTLWELKPTVDEFLEMIDTIYNRKSTNRLPLAFWAREQIKIARSAQKGGRPKKLKAE